MTKPTPPPETEEKVNHPQHYGGDTTYETIKVIEAWALDFCLGNAVKYISRAGKKGTDDRRNSDVRCRHRETQT